MRPEAKKSGGLAGRVWPALLVLLIIGVASLSVADDTIVVSVTMNQRPQGDFFVVATTDRDFLIGIEDLRAMGLVEVPGLRVERDGVEYVSLKSMRGVRFTFDTDRLELTLEIPPTLLPVTKFDYMPERHPDVEYTGGADSAFVNYRLNFIGGESMEFQSMELASEVGVRTHDILFTTDSTYTRTPGADRFVRLRSAATLDDRAGMRRFTLGDFFASSGELGSSLNMGGISISKAYRIDPYFIRQPMFNTTGLIDVPSDVEVYLDGMLIRRERISPGGFELSNISSYNGASDIELVIKDAFGRTQRVSYPFYFTNTVLAKGLHEYSYNLGFERQEFGTRSNHYGEGVLSAFHRLGITDYLTAGFEAEATPGINSFGLAASYLNNRFGVTNAAVLLSSGRGRGDGHAGLVSHTYSGRRWGARLLLKGFSRDYSTVDTSLSIDRSKFEAGVGASYGSNSTGTASLDYTTVEKHSGSIRKTFTATYSRALTRDVSVYSTYKNIVDDGVVNNELFIVLTINPWAETFASASWKIDRNSNREELQVTRSTPFGEGYGYRATYSRTDEAGETTNVLNPFVQYNGRYGIYTAEYRALESTSVSNEGYEFSAAGGLAYVGGAWGASRPVTDSFGVVRVGDIKGVRVMNNNQDVGRTNSKGELFVTELSSYYDNQISIDPATVPIDYSINSVERIVSPALRSGTLIEFDAERIRAVTGVVSMKGRGRSVPLEFYEVSLDGGEIVFPTGRGGEFYIEDIGPGQHRGTVATDMGPCAITFEVLDSEDTITDLGEVACEQAI